MFAGPKSAERCASARRRGAVAIQVALAITAIVGFAALTIDVGAMYNAKADLQRTADAAALAAASRLAAFDEGDPVALARAEAVSFANKNTVFGRYGAGTNLAPSDIEFGRAVYNAGTGSYDFQPTTSFPDAVRVRVRLESNSPNGALALKFARIFGYNEAEIDAEAIAMMVPRDIAVVADLSGSHTDDSELRNYRTTEINLFDVWDGFPGGIDEAGSMWTGTEFPVDGNGYSPQMAGPAWGIMKRLGYGTESIDSSYNPATDPGLLYLPKNVTWSDAQLEQALGDQGYVQDEIDIIMSSAHDSMGGWDTRVVVALGLARWYSGIPGGLSQTAQQMGIGGGMPTGDGDNWITGDELQWTETIGNRTIAQSAAIWGDYINNYSDKTWSLAYRANHGFRSRFGIKTFINYLMERRPTHDETPEFAGTPTQPMQAVKDAVEHLTATLEGLDTDDRLSLEVYGTTARHEVDLTANYQAVSDRLSEMQAAHYDSWTNIGGGIERAIEELTNSNAGDNGARGNSRKVIFLLTDGQANVAANGAVGDEYQGALYARNAAAAAVAAGIRIFTVSVGSDADQLLMSDIAQTGSGTHFHAEGSIDTYSAQLEAIFNTLGGGRPVELIR